LNTIQIIILGTGGNCIDILDSLLEVNRSSDVMKYRCQGFLDDDPKRWGSLLHGVPVLGPLSKASDESFNECVFINGIGSPASFWRKPDIIQKTGVSDERFTTVIHPSAQVSRFASLGKGTVVLQNVTIASDATVGNHVIILPNTVISHDDVIGDYCCLAGGVCVSGNVTIGCCCYLGSNSSIINGVSIGDFCMVGLGSNVLRDVPPGSVVVGNPARYLRPTVAARSTEE